MYISLVGDASEWKYSQIFIKFFLLEIMLAKKNEVSNIA